MNIIIGAGVSGLSAGHVLKNECLILERSGRPGGLSGPYQVNGFEFDHGGHYFHFQNKAAVQNHVQRFHSFRAYRRNSKVFLLKRFIPYSLQYHLAYLPPRLRAAIVGEIMQARHAKAETLREFLLAHFGRHLHDLFFEPFLEKFYGRPLDGLLAGMDKGSIPVPEKGDVQRGALEKKRFGEGYNPVFYYPRSGSGSFIESYSRPLRQYLRVNERVTRIDRRRKIVYTAQGSYKYENLINTMPLKEFLSILEPRPPFPWERLNHLSTLVVNAVLARRRRRFHWLYLPDAAMPFYRVGYYPGGTEATAVYLEKTVRAGDRLDHRRMARDMAQTLLQTGMIAAAREILFHDVKSIPVSYVVFDREWPRLVPPLLAYLERQRIFSIGRYGGWNYSSMADDMQTALATARRIMG